MPQSMCLFFDAHGQHPKFSSTAEPYRGCLDARAHISWHLHKKKLSSEIGTLSGPSQGFPNKWLSRVKLSQGAPLEILRSNHAVSLAKIHHKMLHGHKNRARNPEYCRLDIRTKKLPALPQENALRHPDLSNDMLFRITKHAL